MDSVIKDAGTKKDSSTNKNYRSTLNNLNKPKIKHSPLKKLSGNIKSNDLILSDENIAQELIGMELADRNSSLLELQKTYGNQYVQRVLGIQANLKISEPGDIYEQEADRVADHVMQMPEPDKVKTKYIDNNLLRSEEKNKSELVQLKMDETAKGEVSARDNFISNLGSGKPLDNETKAFMEPRFGHDFSQVRVHNDSNANKAARAINAKAFTIGHEIVFGKEYHTPSDPHGQKLIAHELTHIIQQKVGSTKNKSESRRLVSKSSPDLINDSIGYIQRQSVEDPKSKTLNQAQEWNLQPEDEDIVHPSKNYYVQQYKKLEKHKGLINSKIDQLVQNEIKDHINGIIIAGDSFRNWVTLRKIFNPTGTLIEIGAAIISMIQVLSEENPYLALIENLLYVFEAIADEKLDSNKASEEMAIILHQRLLKLANELSKIPNKYGSKLQNDEHKYCADLECCHCKWVDIGRLIVAEEGDDVLKRKLLYKSEPSDKSWAEIYLKTMITEFLIYQSDQELHNAKLFVNQEMMRYMIDTERYKEELKEKAQLETENLIGEQKLSMPSLK